MRRHFLISMALFMVFSFYSCRQDPSVTFAYSVTSSEDLLNYLIPLVTYTDANEQIILNAIYKQKCRKSSAEGVSATINGVTQTVKGLGNYSWLKRVHFDTLSVSSDMSQNYTPQLTPTNTSFSLTVKEDGIVSTVVQAISSLIFSTKLFC